MTGHETSSAELHAYLERLLVPLLDKEQALAFLRRAAAPAIQEMETELQQAVRLMAQDLRRRLEELRARVAEARTTEDLLRLNDPVLAPRLVLDPDSDVWEHWPRADLREALIQAREGYERVARLARTARPGSLLAHQYEEEARSLNKHLVEVQRRILQEWLDYVERNRLQGDDAWPPEWDVDVRLQVPLVVSERVVDFIDAEVTASARNPRAFVTRTFAVFVLAPHTALIPGLRRVQVAQHFLPPEEHIIVVVPDRTLIRPLQQHNVFVVPADEVAALAGEKDERANAAQQ